MGFTITYKILKDHLVDGDLECGKEIGIKIDQTLTQDATGTMAYLQLEAMNIDRVSTEKSVAYIDHNTLQSGFENADDHKYIASVAYKYGIYYSKAGNGICHQVHLERFGVPGKTLIGSDSHTPTGGGIGMLSFGAGGLDVALAMGGKAYYITCPKVVKVNLTGRLRSGVSAKDVILEILRRLSVKGGVSRVLEYYGDGVETLSVPERATITNMGTELGATTSIFPSDDITKEFLSAQGRGSDYVPLSADSDAKYDEEIFIDLSALVPMAAMPHMPDNVKPVSEIGKIKINQCCIGSCTNSSYQDLMKVAGILKGKKIHSDVSLTISPGSMQVFYMISKNGALSDLIASGARILESSCGPCIGMGQAPESGGVSLRTFNRNFEGRSGTQDASVYLVSPEVAAVSAIEGYLTDPMGYSIPSVEAPKSYDISDNLIVSPSDDGRDCEISRGPNIKPFPIGKKLDKTLSVGVCLKVSDNITTDHILPAGASLLPYRSNIPHYSNYCFINVDKEFPKRCMEIGSGVIIAGNNYGQGSSREHAALVPLYLGIKCVIAKSFARIHSANLINSGIIPMVFLNEDDYDRIDLKDELCFDNIYNEICNSSEISVFNKTKSFKFMAKCELSERQKKAILAGGMLLVSE